MDFFSFYFQILFLFCPSPEKYVRFFRKLTLLENFFYNSWDIPHVWEKHLSQLAYAYEIGGLPRVWEK